MNLKTIKMKSFCEYHFFFFSSFDKSEKFFRDKILLLPQGLHNLLYGQTCLNVILVPFIIFDNSENISSILSFFFFLNVVRFSLKIYSSLLSTTEISVEKNDRES